jgi:urease gamma subunit
VPGSARRLGHAPPLPIGWLASLLELGAGRGYNPIVGKETPNNFEGARSVILGQDHRFLFATNAGDNSVSSFSVGDDGKLTLLDAKRTGNVVPGRSGSAKSLAYDASTSTLFVCHALGPDHIRLMAVSMDGRLTARAERYTVNTADKTDRVATMVTLSPDGKFLVVGTTFDEPAKPNPDGSPILWVSRDGEAPHSVASNAPDPDGLAVFPVTGHGALGVCLFQDGGGGSPWFPHFLHNRPDTFVIGYAVADGLALAMIDEDGQVATGPVVKIDTSLGLPSELCWLSISADDKWVFATNFGYSYVTSSASRGTSCRWRRIRRARRSPATARSEHSTEPSAAARATTGSPRTAPTSTRCTGTPRSSWVTRSSRTARSRRSPARTSRTTVGRGLWASDMQAAPRVETWVSALMLSPREMDKLVIYQVAELARRRRNRGLKLNFPESIAVICEALLEAARDGRSVADVVALGQQVLTRDDVMDGVPEMVTLVQVEATFRTGTQLVSVTNPIP